MKRNKTFLIFFVMIFSFALSSCKITEVGSTSYTTTSNETSFVDTSDDTKLNELKSRYEELLSEKERLERELLYLQEQYSSASLKVQSIQELIDELEEEMASTYPMFQHLENNILLSSVLITHYSYEGDRFWIFKEDVLISGSQGSGFIIKSTSDYYYVLTNNHVIFPDENADSEKIYVYDYYVNQYEATLLFNEAAYDMALLRISKIKNAKNLPVIELAGSNPKKGDIAIAIGNPHGQLNSIGIGSVIGYGKVNLASPSEDSKVTYDCIVHDAFMLSGNSGGMLINENYQVIGINSWGRTIDTYEHHQGMSSPVEKIREFLNRHSFVL